METEKRPVQRTVLLVARSRHRQSESDHQRTQAVAGNPNYSVVRSHGRSAVHHIRCVFRVAITHSASCRRLAGRRSSPTVLHRLASTHAARIPCFHRDYTCISVVSCMPSTKLTPKLMERASIAPDRDDAWLHLRWGAALRRRRRRRRASCSRRTVLCSVHAVLPGGYHSC